MVGIHGTADCGLSAGVLDQGAPWLGLSGYSGCLEAVVVFTFFEVSVGKSDQSSDKDGPDHQPTGRWP